MTLGDGLPAASRNDRAKNKARTVTGAGLCDETPLAGLNLDFLGDFDEIRNLVEVHVALYLMA